MLQVARLAPRLLGDSAGLVASFLRSQLNADGGFANRAGDSDLYYTVFGIEGLLALRAEVPWEPIAGYVRGFTDIDALDLVHTSCLARCWAALPAELRRDMPREQIRRRVLAFRSKDNAFNQKPNKPGTLYGCFVAFGAFQDIGEEIPERQAIIDCIARLRTDDGGYGNGEGPPVGLTPPTAAAVTLLRALGQPVPAGVAEWLLSRYAQGGFFAVPLAPIPDLLSTATALHALVSMHTDIEPIREGCLDFVDSLWTNRGGFYGQWADDALDCEYTYYGLLALGHLAI